MLKEPRMRLSNLVIFSVPIFVFVTCQTAMVRAQVPELPPGFLVPSNESKKAFFDGDYMESLRQTCKLMEWLNTPSNQKLLIKAGWSHSLFKAFTLSHKAAVLAELGCPKHAAVAHHDARGHARTLAGAGFPVPHLLASIEFMEADVFRPIADFGMKGFEKFADPYRSKQALERCSVIINQHLMGDQSDFASRLRAKQFVALAQVLMCDPLDPTTAEPSENRYKDAKLALREAMLLHEKCSNWKLVIDPDQPFKFKQINQLKNQQKMSSEQEIFLKGTAHAALGDWVDWRLTQAELQARLEQEDPTLGWQLASAEEQFAEMDQSLAAQFGAEHPICIRIKIIRAKWFLFLARRECKAKDPNLVLAKSFLDDCRFAIDKIRACKKLSPRQAMECNFIELATLDQLTELAAEKNPIMLVREEGFERRRKALREAADPDVFEKHSGKNLVDGRGCPKKKVNP